MSERSWSELVIEFEREILRKAPPAEPLSAVDHGVITLRRNLMREELSELESAMVYGAPLAEVCDGIADLLYVVVGTANAYGVGPVLDRLFREVHASNMTKTITPAGAGEKYGTDKPKGAGFRAPRLAEILDDYRDACRAVEES